MFIEESISKEQDKIYKHIGEYVVSFQWIENQLREIGWYILDPEKKDWPPKALRNKTNCQLANEVKQLYLEAIPKCNLNSERETDFINTFNKCVELLHQIRKARNTILHSAFIECKADGEAQGIIRTDPKIKYDESGEVIFNREILSPSSFESEMNKIADVGWFLNRAYLQLIHRYPDGRKDIDVDSE